MKIVKSGNQIKLELSNGIIASIISMQHGLLNSCMSWYKEDPGKSFRGPQEAFDDEVVTWLGELATKPSYAVANNVS